MDITDVTFLICYFDPDNCTNAILYTVAAVGAAIAGVSIWAWRRGRG